MGPFIENRQKGSSTPEHVLPYRTFLFGTISYNPTMQTIYQIVPNPPPNQDMVAVEKKMNYELDFTRGAGMWTHG